METHPATSNVAYLDTYLTREALFELLNPKIHLFAVVVRNYYSQTSCMRMIERLANSDSKFLRYDFAPDIGFSKIGATFGEACVNRSLLQPYFRKAPEQNDAFHKLFYPEANPIDHLRADLDKLNPNGAAIATMHGNIMLSGMLRRTELNSGIPPHQDDITEEYPESDWIPECEIVSNIYLSMPGPGGGGELEIFNMRPNYANTLNEQYNPEVETFVSDSDAAKINDTVPIIITPTAGDLILFRGSLVHRVNRITSGSRITSCFHFAKAKTSPEGPIFCWI